MTDKAISKTLNELIEAEAKAKAKAQDNANRKSQMLNQMASAGFSGPQIETLQKWFVQK